MTLSPLHLVVNWPVFTIYLYITSPLNQVLVMALDFFTASAVWPYIASVRFVTPLSSTFIYSCLIVNIALSRLPTTGGGSSRLVENGDRNCWLIRTDESPAAIRRVTPSSECAERFM